MGREKGIGGSFWGERGGRKHKLALFSGGTNFNYRYFVAQEQMRRRLLPILRPVACQR